MTLYDDPSKNHIGQSRPYQESNQAMRVWHEFQLEVRRLGEVFNDVQAFDTEQYERKKNDVNKLNREE